jgi:heme-degrading monooxygenase HmoA
MKDRFNNLLNIIMGSTLGVFIGHAIFRYVYYKKHPKMYAIQSAPWYTSIIIYGVVALSIMLIAFALKMYLLKKMKERIKMSHIVKTPQPPYYSVIFTSLRTEDDKDYGKIAEMIFSEAEKIEGFIGAESLRDENGFGVTISYWKSIDSINVWKKHAGHMDAKNRGRKDWYSEYMLRICKVEMDRHFELPTQE